MKSVLISIKPYWLFLIMANKMGWKSAREKIIEVRKTFPKDKDWDKTVILYCTKDKTSFNRIPKEYQPIMERLLGKVIGEFVCDTIITDKTFGHDDLFNAAACLSVAEVASYFTEKNMYGWHISELKIYDKPKELSEFRKPCENDLYCEECAMFRNFEDKCENSALQIKRPPQSWCYVEV